MAKASEAILNIRQRLEDIGYVCDDAIATALFLSQELGKPLLVEGPPGVGKTELAKAAASLTGRTFLRLQCYEGLDEAKALYEWKYGKQLLYTQVLKERLGDLLAGARNLKESLGRLHEFDDTFFSQEFLEPRPLLKALQDPKGAVLLIDEIDKADEEFEAFLLEILSDYQISIPEIGVIGANVKPMAFLTSNHQRELGDALRRRCLHLYIPYPDAAREKQILRARAPALDEQLRAQLVAFVQSLRLLDLRKHPAISETIDWARALTLLNAQTLSADLVRATLNVLLKTRDDVLTVEPEAAKLVQAAVKGAQIWSQQ